MKRSICVRVASAGLVLAASLGVGAPAGANHHGPTSAVCAVTGKVNDYDGPGGSVDPINSKREHNWYVFDDTELACSGTVMGTPVTPLTSFAVTAGGRATGILSSDGEDCNDGKSMGAGRLDANNGSIQMWAKVYFVRAGALVYAWGPLYEGTSGTVQVGRFDAVLSFIPNPPTDIAGCTGTDESAGVSEATMDGVAAVTDHAVPVPLVTP